MKTYLMGPRFPGVQAPPPDPWKYLGPKGTYHLSHYRRPSVQLSWFATFIVTCMGDILDSIARQGFDANALYPGGHYTCELDYSFPSGSEVRFELQLEKVAAPDWYMTFADISDDLEALWYAALFFDGQSATPVIPEMDVEVYRSIPATPAKNFLASKGNISFGLALAANHTDA